MHAELIDVSKAAIEKIIDNLDNIISLLARLPYVQLRVYTGLA